MTRLLPTPPRVALSVSPAADDDPWFLEVTRHRVSATPEGGTPATVVYASVTRRALDAVVMVAYYRHQDRMHVYLRSCVRPPLALRSEPLEASGWELPAGLVEPGETPREAASRELEEEVGFVVAPEAFRALGPVSAPSPAVIAEIHTYLAAPVDPSARGVPREDGSALERGGRVIAVPLDVALAACAAGEVLDAKTELGLRRLAEWP